MQVKLPAGMPWGWIAAAVVAIVLLPKLAKAIGGGVSEGVDQGVGWLVSLGLPDVVRPTDSASSRGVADLYRAYGLTTLNGHWDDGSAFSRDYQKAKVQFGTDNPTATEILSVRDMRLGIFEVGGG